jgi:hypothetical protein
MKYSIINKPGVDELFHWKQGEGIPGPAGCCRIRIYRSNQNDSNQDPERWVVIGSEVKENQGQSITHCIQNLFTKVCESYKLNPEQTTWIEHYNQESYKDKNREEEYSLVSISNKGRTSWKYLKQEDVEKLIEEL